MLEKKPLPPSYNPQQIQWFNTGPGDEVTTGSPQKMFRYVTDAIQARGYVVLPSHYIEPTISAQAIGDTGTTKGYILAERPPVDIPSPWNMIRIVGVILALIGAIILLIGLLQFLGYYDFYGFIVMIIGAIILAVGYFLTKMHRFISHLVMINLTGEVYKSGLTSAVASQFATSDSQRVSMVSEVRITYQTTSVISMNEGMIRRAVEVKHTDISRQDFEAIRYEIGTNILPKVVLQKSTEMADLHRAMPSAGFDKSMYQQQAPSVGIRVGDIGVKQTDVHQPKIQPPTMAGAGGGIMGPQPQPTTNVQPSQPGFKFCLKCGNQLPSDAMFCSKCGGKQ